MRMNLKAYMLLVNRVPGIQERYKKYRERVKGPGRIKAWGYLLKLNIQYYLLGQRDLKNPLFLNPDKGRKLCMTGSESASSYREAPESLAKKLSEYDVVSFDVFDTLILRCFDRPAGVFYMVGQKLGYPDLERIRREIEEKARKKKFKASGHREVTYEDIWEMMEEETGIPADRGRQAEWEAELKYCFANPYFLEVIRYLRACGKKLVITSDMYLRKEQIRELLIQSGYPEFDEYFVSCEYGTGKGEGALYGIVKRKYGLNLRYAHIGDNVYADQKKAEEAGFSVFPYVNVNLVGNEFRSADMSAIAGSMYRGTVNAHLHNGLAEYGMAYEFGFVYGGFFVLGYCQFIHEYVRTHPVDKILFLARDGDILHQVYQMLYPDEARRCEYVYWSRLAATKMTAGYFKYDYFRRFLYHKVNQDYTLEKIFSAMELSDMLEDYMAWKAGKCGRQTVLTLKEADSVKCYLTARWDKVLRHYDEQLEAGKTYFEKVLAGCRRVIAVDVGWAGSGAVSLDYVVNQIWHMNCEITGLLAGTNSAGNTEPDNSEAQLQNGKLVSFLFSQAHNRDVWKIHNPGKGHNVIVELLLASEQASFRGFTKSGDGFEFSDKTEEIDSRQVQNGVLDFVRIFRRHFPDVASISGRDCMAPVLLLYQNESWLEQVIDEKKFTMNLE